MTEREQVAIAVFANLILLQTEDHPLYDYKEAAHEAFDAADIFLEVQRGSVRQ